MPPPLTLSKGFSAEDIADFVFQMARGKEENKETDFHNANYYESMDSDMRKRKLKQNKIFKI